MTAGESKIGWMGERTKSGRGEMLENEKAAELMWKKSDKMCKPEKPCRYKIALEQIKINRN